MRPLFFVILLTNQMTIRMRKRVIPIIAVLFMVSLASQVVAQRKNDLKGPAAKNFKPWQSTDTGIKLYSKAELQVVQGPSAKNAKPWETQPGEFRVLSQAQPNRNELKGPKAKNFKPWQKGK